MASPGLPLVVDVILVAFLDNRWRRLPWFAALPEGWRSSERGQGWEIQEQEGQKQHQGSDPGARSDGDTEQRDVQVVVDSEEGLHPIQQNTPARDVSFRFASFVCLLLLCLASREIRATCGGVGRNGARCLLRKGKGGVCAGDRVWYDSVGAGAGDLSECDSHCPAPCSSSQRLGKPKTREIETVKRVAYQRRSS